MNYNEDELATRTLRDLGLVGSEETPSAADLQWAIESNSSEIMLLSSLGIPIWNGSQLSIPQEYLTTLSRHCGISIAASYGLMPPADAILARRESMRELTMLASPQGAVNPRPIYTNDISPSRAGRFVFAAGQ